MTHDVSNTKRLNQCVKHSNAERVRRMASTLFVNAICSYIYICIYIYMYIYVYIYISYIYIYIYHACSCPMAILFCSLHRQWQSDGKTHRHIYIYICYIIYIYTYIYIYIYIHDTDIDITFCYSTQLHLQRRSVFACCVCGSFFSCSCLSAAWNIDECMHVTATNARNHLTSHELRKPKSMYGCRGP